MPDPPSPPAGTTQNGILAESTFTETENVYLVLPSPLPPSKFFCSILASFDFRKFWSQNMKALAKDKEVNIAVTYHQVTQAILKL